jgi:hypothetical protein
LRGRHPAWLEDSNERVENVEAQYKKEMNVLETQYSSGITVLEEWRMLGRIMHELFDGHSTVYSMYADERYISDLTQIKEYGPPVKINGEPAEDVFKKFLEVYQYETEHYAETTFYANIVINEVYLKWIGVDTTDGVTMTFNTPEGEKDYHYSFVPVEEIQGRSTGSGDSKWVYYSIDKEKRIGIFTLEDCTCNDEYMQTVKDFFTEVRDNNVSDIIIDLRWNGGGNSRVGNEFIRYLDVKGYYSWAAHLRYGNLLLKYKREYVKNKKLAPVFYGNVYVLTNSRTFSSAMDFTMYIMDNGLGKVVGEASGNLPDSYGDLLHFDIPNSKLAFTVSFKRWFRIDESKAGQPLEPDYPCDPNEALEKAYEIILEKRAE